MINGIKIRCSYTAISCRKVLLCVHLKTEVGMSIICKVILTIQKLLAWLKKLRILDPSNIDLDPSNILKSMYL
jgi:hypothetical protein